jgi:hypothetical protein
MPLTSSLDIYRTANLLIKQHGEEASIQATMKADEMLAQGSLDGRALWLGVIKAIEELQMMEPDGAVH